MHRRTQHRYAKLFGHFDGIAWRATAVLFVISLLGFLGRVHWTLELFSHFRVQYLQLALFLAGVCLWVRRNKHAATLVVVAALNYAFILPLYMGKPSTANIQGETTRAMLINLLSTNIHTDKVLQSIRSANPDILILEEVSPEWAFNLSVLSTNYPYNIVKPRGDNFGIMLLSKHPLGSEEVVDIGGAGVPSIVAEVQLPHAIISIIGTHPLPPVNTEYSLHRNKQLAALSDTVKKQRFPVLLIGDLNTTPWSPYFVQLLKDSGLKDSVKGYGFQPTWPSENPLMRIPLDHILHSPEITVISRFTGPKVGSDHLPVIADFQLGKHVQ